MTERTFTDRLADVFRLFDGARGHLRTECRSFAGFGEQALSLTPPFNSGAPMPAVNLLLEGWTLRLSPITRDMSGNLVELPILIALWKPPTRFEKRKHIVLAEGQEALAAALSRMPSPSVLIDAGPEVWAGWRLERAITDMSGARAVLLELAERLGADRSVLDNIGTFTLPVAAECVNDFETPPLGI